MEGWSKHERRVKSEPNRKGKAGRNYGINGIKRDGGKKKAALS
jgi:hypothetical protein